MGRGAGHTSHLSEQEMVALDSEENTPIISSEGDDLDHQEEDPEETQVEETKYGWMVVAASFLCNLVIDGNVIICFPEDDYTISGKWIWI